jgi:hypothetical protein
MHPGGVAEWLKAAVSKTVNGGFVVRGFESLPLRCSRRKACKRAPYDDLIANAERIGQITSLLEPIAQIAESLHTTFADLDAIIRGRG